MDGGLGKKDEGIKQNQTQKQKPDRHREQYDY